MFARKIVEKEPIAADRNKNLINMVPVSPKSRQVVGGENSVEFKSVASSVFSNN